MEKVGDHEPDGWEGGHQGPPGAGELARELNADPHCAVGWLCGLKDITPPLNPSSYQ